MFQYIVKRLLLMIVTLFGITVITFVVTRLTPGEPSVISEGRNDPRMGGYDSILEQNRRNLGLDKPMLLNFNFENRDYLARQAVADFCRPVKFWQDSAETNLRLSGAVAIEPVPIKIIGNCILYIFVRPSCAMIFKPCAPCGYFLRYFGSINIFRLPGGKAWQQRQQPLGAILHVDTF